MFVYIADCQIMFVSFWHANIEGKGISTYSIYYDYLVGQIYQKSCIHSITQKRRVVLLCHSATRLNSNLYINRVMRVVPGAPP